jgi:pimeloyl-ACP methyl ester carboxylesterase
MNTARSVGLGLSSGLRAAAAMLLVAAGSAPLAAQRLALAPCHAPGVGVDIRCGTYMTYENRVTKTGRRIPLYVRVVPAAAPTPAPDPFVFVSAGGPGTTNSDLVAFAVARGWSRNRDIVMVDLRGTSGGDRLDCRNGDDVPLGYLRSPFDSAVVASCRTALAAHADLRAYTTANAMDDLYDVLVALDYAHVNLWGASGGTREVLEFMRRHPGMVRSAIVEGVAPVSFKNPLPHAQAAQEALDSLFTQCDRDVPCHAAFPALRVEFARLREAALRQPLRVRAPADVAGRDTTIELLWYRIAETIRSMSYTVPGGRTIPYVVHQASAGNFAPLIEAGIQSSQRTRNAIRFGFLLSQTCLEDVPRISEGEIARETAHTYLGEARVREQQAACRAWVGATKFVGDSTPVRSSVPVFLLSGTIDPVTRPRFAIDAARYLPHSVLVIAPGGHVPRGPCIDAMEQRFLDAPTSPIDSSCVRSMTLPPFRIR